MTFSSLNDLVTCDGLAPFLGAFASKTRWYHPVARAAAVEALLPWTVIDSLIANGLVTGDRFRVAVNGVDLSNALYVDERTRLRPSAVQGFATQGATLIINDIGGLVSAIGDLEIEVERDLRCRVGVNCYITFGAVSAFIPHHDAHDVLILQIHGAKRWRSFGFPVAFPVTGGRPPVASQAAWEGLMTPGDLLYLPRGEVHDAIPETRPCVHLTIGINEATGIDFLQWLAEKARDVEILRRDLGVLLTGDARALRDQEVSMALRGLLDGADIADYFASRDMAQSIRPLVALGAGQGGGRKFLPETRLLSALRRRFDLTTKLENEIQFTFGKQKFRLSQLSRRALAGITGTHRITVAALAARLDLEVHDRDLVACLEDLAGKSLIAIVA